VKKVTAAEPTARIHRQLATYLRVSLKVVHAGTCAWNLVIRDADFHAIQVIDRSAFDLQSSVWSRRVPGDTAYIDLVDCASGAAPVVESPEYVWMPEFAENRFYSVQVPNAPTWMPIEKAASRFDKRMGDSVGLLTVIGNADEENWACSGVLIERGLFLTNWHCISALDTANASALGRILIDLSWDADDLSRDYQVLKVAAGDPRLDFAILEVRPVASGEMARVAVLKAEPPVISETRVIHHPAARRKQLSDGCRIRELNFPTEGSNSLSHDCDTEGGSSGSPLFDDKGVVVGLHYCGFPEGDPLKRNRALRIDKILEHLERNNEAILKRLTTAR
jgi:hypothetical protein